LLETRLGVTGPKNRTGSGDQPLQAAHLPLNDQADDLRKALPLFELIAKLAATAGGDRVVARAAVVLGRPPDALDVAAMLEALERRIERSLIDVETSARHLLNPDADAPAVHRLERQRLEDKEIDA